MTWKIKGCLRVEGLIFFPQFSNFKIPRLISHGKQNVVEIETARELNKELPHSKMIEIDECCHFPDVENLKNISQQSDHL
jgi:pimeloyl-ACP methyl ester carboxylesterase